MTEAEVLVLAAIVGLAYWRKEAALYGLAALALFMFGAVWFDDYGARYGIPVFMLGVYSAWKALRPYLPF